MNGLGALQPFNRAQWQNFKNVGGTTIPPHGVFEIEDSSRIDSGTGDILHGKRTSLYYVRTLAINGPKEVAVNGYGVCCTGGECYAKINTSDVPAIGKILGIQKDSYILQHAYSGVVVVGDVNTGTNGLARVRFQSDSRAVVRFSNGSGETVPFGAVMSITSEVHTTDGEGVYYVIGKPSATVERLVLVNITGDVANNDYGWAAWLTDAPGWVSYNSGSGSPTRGQRWGIKSGQWTLEKNRYGFLVTATAKTVNGVACLEAKQSEVTRLRGKTNAAHTKGSTGAISIYDGVGTDTSIDLAGVDNLFADLAIDKVVFIEEIGGNWSIYAAEC